MFAFTDAPASASPDKPQRCALAISAAAGIGHNGYAGLE